ncbi:hypothetical protein C0J52_18464 [Blattella germanica]|nr:hypothetical protein C0J52_18464 [Blattella germanica]
MGIASILNMRFFNILNERYHLNIPTSTKISPLSESSNCMSYLGYGFLLVVVFHAVLLPLQEHVPEVLDIIEDSNETAFAIFVNLKQCVNKFNLSVENLLSYSADNANNIPKKQDCDYE